MSRIDEYRELPSPRSATADQALVGESKGDPGQIAVAVARRCPERGDRHSGRVPTRDATT